LQALNWDESLTNFHPKSLKRVGKMEKRFKDFCIGFFFLLFGIYVFFESARIASFTSAVAEGDPGVAFFPKGISMILIALSVILIAKNFQRPVKIDLTGLLKKIWGRTIYLIKTNLNLLCCMGLLALYPYAVTKTGYLATSIVFSVLLLKLLSTYNWIKVLLVANIFVFACYGIFTYLFSVPLP
jgi:hypothetical protein